MLSITWLKPSADIAVEIPSNIILKVLGARYYLPSLVIAFGLISMCTSFVHNYEGLLACRFFLGLAEGGMMPGIAYYLSCFYRRAELLFRVGIFISGTTLAGAFGGLLAAGLTNVPRWGTAARPIHTWRNIFFFEGLVTLMIAASIMFFLPSSPEKCKFLTPEDRYIALQRINREHKESAKEKIRPHHIYRAIFNINNTFCALGFFFINVSVQSFSLFLPTILNALGWAAIRSQLYSVPPYVVGAVWSIFVAWLSDKFQKRGLFILVGTALAIIGYSMLVATNSNTIKYLGTFFACCGAFPLGPAFLAWALNNAAGPSVRAITSAYIVAIGNCGAIVATWTYLPRDAPNYRTGHALNVGAQCCAAILTVLAILYMKWENRQRQSGKRDNRLEGLSEQERETLGYRHPEFRYME